MPYAVRSVQLLIVFMDASFQGSAQTDRPCQRLWPGASCYTSRMSEAARLTNDTETWATVRDAAEKTKEGERRLGVEGAEAVYEFAPLPDGSWAVQRKRSVSEVLAQEVRIEVVS